MKNKAVTVGIVAGAVAAAVGVGTMINKPAAVDTAHPKAGFFLEKKSDGKYKLYKDEAGKKEILGDDLTAEQADFFVNKELDRHKK